MRQILIRLLFLATSVFSEKASAQATKKADSLYIAKSWQAAITAYEAVLKNEPANALAWNRVGFSYHNLGEYEKAKKNYQKALGNDPSELLEQVVLSRLSRVFSMENNLPQSIEYLSKSITLGYGSIDEFKTNSDFQNLRKDRSYPDLLKKVAANAFPCMADSHAREFDFWVGEWDVFDSQGKSKVGRSKIEIASSGCIILENFYGLGDPPFEGKSMNFVNAKTGKWEQLWAGPEGIGLNNPRRFIDGEYIDGAMRFKFEMMDTKGEKKIGKFTFFNKSQNEVRQLKELSTNNGQTWNTVYDFTYIRK